MFVSVLLNLREILAVTELVAITVGREVHVQKPELVFVMLIIVVLVLVNIRNVKKKISFLVFVRTLHLFLMQILDAIFLNVPITVTIMEHVQAQVVFVMLDGVAYLAKCHHVFTIADLMVFVRVESVNVGMDL